MYLHDKAESQLELQCCDDAWNIKFTFSNGSVIRFSNRTDPELIRAQIRGMLKRFAIENGSPRKRLALRIADWWNERKNRHMMEQIHRAADKA